MSNGRLTCNHLLRQEGAGVTLGVGGLSRGKWKNIVRAVMEEWEKRRTETEREMIKFRVCTSWFSCRMDSILLRLAVDNHWFDVNKLGNTLYGPLTSGITFPVYFFILKPCPSRKNQRNLMPERELSLTKWQPRSGNSLTSGKNACLIPRQLAALVSNTCQ